MRVVVCADEWSDWRIEDKKPARVDLANAAWDRAHIEQVQRHLERVQFEAQSKSHLDSLSASQRRAAERSIQKAAQLRWWVQQSAYEKDARARSFDVIRRSQVLRLMK